jgi:sugar O-acyltransferase (sialic acid O-acetyltransferase NeuD family)
MKAKDLIIIGGGGHTRVLIGAVQAAGLSLRGIVTSNPKLIGSSIMGVPVLGLESEFSLSPEEVTLINGVGNLANSAGSGLEPRAAVHERYSAKGFAFLPLLAPQAMVQPHVTLGAGAQVMAGAVIQPASVIGDNVIINTRASVDHDCRIDAHCHIAPGAVLCGHVVVGAYTHIGAGAVITQGVRLGSNVVVGAGAIVTRPVPDGMIVRPAMGEQTPLTATPHA